MEICVLHSKYKVFWGSRGGLGDLTLDSFWNHFRSKIWSKIDAKIDAEKVMKFDAKMVKNDANMGPKIMIFWVCLRKGDFMKMLVLPGKYKVFWGIAHQKSINNSSKNHQKIIKDSCSKKLCKKDGKVVQNGAKMGSKIAQKSIQKSFKKWYEKVCLLKKFRKWSNRLNYLQFNKTTYR